MKYGDFEVRMLEPGEVMTRFFELRALLEPAFEKAAGEILCEDALLLAGEGKAVVLVGADNSGINTAMIVEFRQYPRKKVAMILAWAGRGRDFYWFFDVLETWARENGAEELWGAGPERTLRLAQRFGFSPIYQVFGKKLTRSEG